MKTDIRVLDAMTSRPITIGPDESIYSCANIMKEHELGSMIIRDNEKVVGIVTEYDIVRKAVAKKIPFENPISDIMSTSLVYVKPNNDIFEALNLMKKNNVRHLPVVDSENNLIGYITLKDILRIQPQFYELIIDKLKIREAERKPLYKANGKGGRCTNCGYYSKDLVLVNNALLCEDCMLI